MTKEEMDARKEHLRYRVWLWEHSPEYLATRPSPKERKGYSNIPNRDYLAPVTCIECNQPFEREVPWQRRCDNCIRQDVLMFDMYTPRDIKSTSLEDVFNGGILTVAEPAPTISPVGRIKTGPRAGAVCKECGGSIYSPTPGCMGCGSWKAIDRPSCNK